MPASLFLQFFHFWLEAKGRKREWEKQLSDWWNVISILREEGGKKKKSRREGNKESEREKRTYQSWPNSKKACMKYSVYIYIPSFAIWRLPSMQLSLYALWSLIHERTWKKWRVIYRETEKRWSRDPSKQGRGAVKSDDCNKSFLMHVL